MDPAAQMRAWVEGAVGGRVVRLEQFDGGKSRAMYAVDVTRDEELLKLVIRQDTGLGPHSGTIYDLPREAGVLRAMEAVAVKSPRVFGISPAGDAILMQRLDGTAVMPADPDLRRRVVESFCEELASLHRADPAGVAMPAPTPKDARAGGLSDLAAWRDGYLRICERHPVMDAGFDWLEAHAPDTGAPVRLLHGDAGPGNFMHADGAVTGLVDWETAQFGDPHLDLGWIWFRTHVLKQDVEADSYLVRYLRVSGLEFDPPRCVYYIAQITLRCAVACAIRTAHEPDYAPRAVLLRGLFEASLADAKNGRLSFIPPLPALVR